jgi:hypothetical protein
MNERLNFEKNFENHFNVLRGAAAVVSNVLAY